MKRNVCVEQLKESDDLLLKQICHIVNWFKLDSNMAWLAVSEMLTIHKIIETLHEISERDGTDNIAFTGIVYEVDEWVVYDINDTEWGKSKELVDALWESLKYVLKEK